MLYPCCVKSQALKANLYSGRQVIMLAVQRPKKKEAERKKIKKGKFECGT